MDSPATIGKPAYAVFGPHSGQPQISVTLTLIKLDGIPWAYGDSVILSDGEVDSDSIVFDKGGLRATAEYVPNRMGAKTLTAFNNRGWIDAPPFEFTAHAHAHVTIATAVGIGL